MTASIVRSRFYFLILAALLATATTAQAETIFLPAATPVFGLTTAPDDSLLVADAGSGIIGIRKGSTTQVGLLTGVTDVAAIGIGNMFAITSVGFGGDGRLYRMSKGSTLEIADLLAFETEVNPDGGVVDPDPSFNTNPFDVAALTGGIALVADAAANARISRRTWLGSFLCHRALILFLHELSRKADVHHVPREQFIQGAPPERIIGPTSHGLAPVAGAVRFENKLRNPPVAQRKQSLELGDAR